MPTLYSKDEFMLRGRKVKYQQIAGPVTDAYWRNNLARARKAARGEYAPASKLVFSQFEPEPLIEVEKTLQLNRNICFVDDQGQPIRFPGVEASVALKNDIGSLGNEEGQGDDDLYTDFGVYPVLWHCDEGEWNGSVSRYAALENSFFGCVLDYEQGRISAMDLLVVTVEGLCEHIRAVEDHKTGKEYRPGDVMEGDDAVTISSKLLAIQYCKALIEHLEDEIQQLKDGTYWPHFDGGGVDDV